MGFQSPFCPLPFRYKHVCYSHTIWTSTKYHLIAFIPKRTWCRKSGPLGVYFLAAAPVETFAQALVTWWRSLTKHKVDTQVSALFLYQAHWCFSGLLFICFPFDHLSVASNWNKQQSHIVQVKKRSQEVGPDLFHYSNCLQQPLPAKRVLVRGVTL